MNATKFREMADRLEQDIEHLLADRLENTPKRQKEGAVRRIDAAHLQRVKDALEKLAAAIDAGQLPEQLAGIKSKAQLLGMLRTKLDTGGYYSVRDTNEYADKSPAAVFLRDWLAGKKTEAEIARDAEAARRAKIQDLEARLKFCDIPGFFPTPPDVIETMLDRAGPIADGAWVLEPSAGKGDIVDALLERTDRSKIGLDVVEVHYTLCDVLGAKGYNVHRCDFLEWKGTKYDLVLMNPPFEKGQEIDHVRHAYDLLKPGGRLVSVMSRGPFYRSDRKATEFREWFDGLEGLSEELPADAFKTAFRSTGVSTRLVILDKAAVAKPANYVKRGGQRLLGFADKQLTLALA